MTGLAGERRVCAFEFEVGLFEVIEVRYLPGLYGVAAIALLPVTTAMNVVEAVASHAGGRRLGARHVIEMARSALEWLVCPAQRKTGAAKVIERLALPPAGRVTVVALCTAGAAMLVVACVARNTLRVEVCVHLRDVARLAGNLLVFACVWEVGGVVVEVD